MSTTLNFTTDTTTYYEKEKSGGNTANFTTFTSKKKLKASNILSGEKLAYVYNLNNLFTSHIHNSLLYAVCKLYYQKTNTYASIVMDLTNGSIAQVENNKAGYKAVETLVCNTTETDVKQTSKKQTSKQKASAK